jgi:hypothetical protein
MDWTNERRKLSELIPWSRNPRQIREREAAQLVESFDEFGQVQTVAVGPDGEILDGHQRQLVLLASEKYGPDHEVDVRVASRMLTEEEREKLVVVLHRGAFGEWDLDLLSDFDVGNLLLWGFAEGELQLDWEVPDLPEAETLEIEEKPLRLLTCPACGHEWSE